MKHLICVLTALVLGMAPAGTALASGGSGDAPAIFHTAPPMGSVGNLYESKSSLPLRYAQAGVSDAPPTAIEQAVSRQQENPERLLTANKLHKYLGIGALIFGAATAMSFGLAEEDEAVVGGGDEKDGGVHGALAVTATGLAAGAVATGFMYHREDVGFDEPLTDPDNLHMALTALGAAGFAAATAMEGGDGHSVFGMLGGLSMLVGVKLTW